MRFLLGFLAALALGAPAGARAQGAAAPPAAAELTVRVLDVGQGDAIYVENGGSRVLLDGGPDPKVLARKLDALGLRNTTLDLVILSHVHADHAGGLRELFRSARGLKVRYFFENKDAWPGAGLAQLRDSVSARVARKELVWRDTDDPCANGRPVCTITLRGGARLRIMRPAPAGVGGANENDRSVAVKLLAPDSARFTMWLAGDAERPELAWFETAGYARDPGMGVDVLKADHHGSCNGIDARYLDLTHPKWVIASVGAHNGFHHMHTQTRTLLRARAIPWYRTDANGDVVIRVPVGRPFTITPTRGTTDASGPSDRFSPQAICK